MPYLPHARTIRRRYGVSLSRRVSAAEVASRIGYTRTHLAHVETCRSTASEELVDLLVSVYGCTRADLVGDGKPTTPPKQPKQPPGPPRRERSDTKSPSRAQPEVNAA